MVCQCLLLRDDKAVRLQTETEGSGRRTAAKVHEIRWLSECVVACISGILGRVLLLASAVHRRRGHEPGGRGRWS
jgi:hypothetical protein